MSVIQYKDMLQRMIRSNTYTIYKKLSPKSHMSLTLIAMVCHNLIELSQHFQILNDVRVLIRNQDQKQFVDWDIDVSNDIGLDMRALPA